MKNATDNFICRLLHRLRYTGAWLLLTIGTSFSTVAHAGPGVWTSGGPYGGYVYALAIDPTTPATLYARTNGSGVFKSTDSGGTWAAANAGLTNLNVSPWRSIPRPPPRSTPGASFTAFASVIDETTNDPTAVEAK